MVTTVPEPSAVRAHGPGALELHQHGLWKRETNRGRSELEVKVGTLEWRRPRGPLTSRR